MRLCDRANLRWANSNRLGLIHGWLVLICCKAMRQRQKEWKREIKWLQPGLDGAVGHPALTALHRLWRHQSHSHWIKVSRGPRGRVSHAERGRASEIDRKQDPELLSCQGPKRREPADVDEESRIWHSPSIHMAAWLVRKPESWGERGL